LLLHRLPDVYSCPVVTEERMLPLAERQSSRALWVVDPLDGTQNFINRDGEFSINIALLVDNTPVLAAIAVPATLTVYLGAAGIGAWKAVQGSCEPLAPTQVDGDIRVVDSKLPTAGGREATERFCRLNGIDAAQVARVGSAAKLAYLAEGKFDLALRYDRLWEWDVAAADCILNAVGCSLLNIDTGLPISYNSTESMELPGFIAAQQWISLSQLDSDEA
ncbi:MAG: hypothetical protein KDD69_16040, partial [Bdellovibrionales bacterium]|nr:hypothetical protein [Bdellovibrionales bacterium]